MKTSTKKIISFFLCSVFLLLNVAHASNQSDVYNAFSSVNYIGGESDNYSDFVLFSEGLQAVQKGTSWGYIDKNGIIVLDFIYDSAEPFIDGVACVELNGKKYCIDQSGTLMHDLSSYDSVTNGGNGTLIVEKNNLYGVVSVTGTVKTAFVWDSISQLQEGFRVVSKNKKYGYIDANGLVVIEPQYVFAHPFNDGAALVETSAGKHCLIDTNSNLLLDDVYSSVTDGLAIIHRDGFWGLADQNGDIHVACEWDDVETPSEGLIAVCKDNLWGFVDYSGYVVIEPQWPFIWNFSDDMAITALASSDGSINQYGFINKVGFEIVKPQYEKIISFSENYAGYYDASSDKWGFLNENGMISIPAQFDFVTPFSNGYAVVRTGNNYSFIDYNGTILNVSNTGSISDITSEKNVLDVIVDNQKENNNLNVGFVVSLILSILLILFFLISLSARSYFLFKLRMKKRNKISKLKNDCTAEPEKIDMNYFHSIINMNRKIQGSQDDDDSFNIIDYYDDLNGEDPDEKSSE